MLHYWIFIFKNSGIAPLLLLPLPPRNVFSREGKVDVLSRASNLMIWSDNDVANDFTTMKDTDGGQKYHPNFLQCGMRTYREYQRRLWDPDAELTLPEDTGKAECSGAWRRR